MSKLKPITPGEILLEEFLKPMGLSQYSLSMLVIPLIMAVIFVFNIIPSLDRYLEKKYKDEFRDYSKKTKKFIPLIY